jgi:O-antigen ligase
VFGRVVFAVVLGLVLISLFVCRSWREILHDLLGQVKTPLGILIVLTFAAWLPNVFISSYPLRSFEAVFRTLILVGTATAFWACLRADGRLINLALRSFVIMAAIAVVFTLLSVTVYPELFWLFRLKGWVSMPIGTNLKGFSSLSVLIIPILVLAGDRFSVRWKIASGLLTVAFLVVVWESYNRSAMAGLLAVLIITALAGLVRTGSKAIVAAIIGAIGIISVAGVYWLHATRAQFASIAPQVDWLFPIWLVDYERQIIWDRAIEFATSPWLGIGANTINLVPGADRIIEGSLDLHVIPSHPHNWGIEIFAETGTIGLIMLIIIILIMGWQALIKWRRSGNQALVIVLMCMAGYWGSGLFNVSYWSAWWQMSFYVCLTFCYAIAYGPIREETAGDAPRHLHEQPRRPDSA